MVVKSELLSSLHEEKLNLIAGKLPEVVPAISKCHKNWGHVKTCEGQVVNMQPMNHNVTACLLGIFQLICCLTRICFHVLHLFFHTVCIFFPFSLLMPRSLSDNRDASSTIFHGWMTSQVPVMIMSHLSFYPDIPLDIQSYLQISG